MNGLQAVRWPARAAAVVSTFLVLCSCSAVDPASQPRAAAVTAPAPAGGDAVHVEGGWLRAAAPSASGVRAYLGLPYAAPPVGELRWRPPVPPSAWAGVKSADTFAADCPTARPLAESRSPAGQSEDCLHLNIWTPAAPAAPGTRRAGSATPGLPVMVWFYGSGYLGGTASATRYDGAALARQGVVLVTVSYRNGVLGFLTHRWLTAESAQRASGNYGILDCIAALQWVQRNAAAFGGDPQRVTVFGQSSGSETVNLLTATPLAKGLFQRAIGESGGAFGQRQPRPLAQSEHDGDAYVARTGAASLAQLREKPTADLFKAEPPRFEPVVDGHLLPADVLAIFSAGRQNDVPTLVGSNADESGLPANLSVAAFTAQARERYGAGARSDAFLARFPAGDDGQARLSAKASMTLLLGDFNTATWATLQRRTGTAPVWQYRFVHVPPRSTGPAAGPTAGPPREGAYHGAEIAYAFANLDREPRAWTDADRLLSQRIVGYWTNFARTGNPNGAGLPGWPQLDPARPQVLLLSPQPQVVERPNSDTIGFFDALFYGPGGLYRPR